MMDAIEKAFAELGIDEEHIEKAERIKCEYYENKR